MNTYPHISFERRWTISGDTSYILGECDALVSALRFLPLPPDVRRRSLEVSLVKGAQATTAIEGNTLSEEQVARIMDGDIEVPESRQYQADEVKNVLDAMTGIARQIMDGAVAPVSPDLIRNFHAGVTRGLPENNSVPGVFRSHEVHVGRYVPPDHREVGGLVARLCEWLAGEFGFRRDGRQRFADSVLEAIVAHVYLVWIHPFGDGNGRTARLLEFYILLRGGLPDSCSHILSNYYNNTRTLYYRELDEAGRTGDLTGFVAYAAKGLLEGLRDALLSAQIEQIKSCWRNFVYDRLDGSVANKTVRRRMARILVGMDLFSERRRDDFLASFPQGDIEYARLAPAARRRDFDRMVSLGLVEVLPNESCRADTRAILAQLPRGRSFGG